MIRNVNGKTPRIGESSWVSEAAYVVGDVEIGENCGVWPGAVIRGDLASVKIGNYVTIQDRSLVAGVPAEILGEPKQEQFIWTERQTYAELARQYKEQGL